MIDPLCYKPWDSVFYDEQGRMGPCCDFRPAWPKQGLGDYFESQRLIKVKEKLMSGEFPDQCRGCQDREKHGNTSLRLEHTRNNIFQERLRYIEVSLDNTCNMNCFMCSPAVSTGVGREYQRLNWIDDIVEHRNHDVLDHLRTVNGDLHIMVTGGEPFMSDKITDLLEIVKDKNWSISISTNCSTINKKALSLLRDIDRVVLQVSLDALGELYSYLRYPSDWDTFNKTLDVYKKHIKNKNFQSIQFNSVISFLNVHQLRDMQEFAKDQKIKLRIDNLLWPKWLGWSVLTDQERSGVLKDLDAGSALYRHIADHRHDINARLEFSKKMPALLDHRGLPIDPLLAQFPALRNCCISATTFG